MHYNASSSHFFDWTTHIEFYGCPWLLCGRETRTSKKGCGSTKWVWGGVGWSKEPPTARAGSKAWKWSDTLSFETIYNNLTGFVK